MQKRIRGAKKNIPEEQQERPAVCICLTFSLVAKILEQELHISHDINAMDTARLLLNWSTVVVITR